MAEQNLTHEERIFAMRMLPHLLSGKTLEDAAAAVLVDDARLLGAVCDQSHHRFIAVGDGRSAMTRKGPGDVIASELTALVYSRLRSI